MRRRGMIFKRCRSLVKSVWPRRGLVLEACLRLAIARARLLLFPLKAQGIRNLVQPSRDQCSDDRPALTSRERKLALDVSWAVRRSAAYLPLDSQCLAQALAGQAMLRTRRIQSVLHFGVACQDAGDLEAHAWLDAAGVEITGYPVHPQFREIGCFRDSGRSLQRLRS